MRMWVILLGALSVWAAHFFALYAIASVMPGQPRAAWFALAATVPALLGAGLILRAALVARRAADPLERWATQVGMAGAVIALIAILWQAAAATLV